ncbi:uncharacterized protein BDW43DRAFT_259124 [Aspergillus alliaceus]|uniref:uncharacterized protein n=1 Tax=Petromyces alliaceus TaxID=209559 RepID=UPI0012A59C46|nr:uncharacterized protein BDW43DRAFT_259124 [Aspergillus alliaceus]KAB8239758.1 hypothetical protein BDW43DRAFT_259124 [Aspergillus alliaceus]
MIVQMLCQYLYVMMSVHIFTTLYLTLWGNEIKEPLIFETLLRVLGGKIGSMTPHPSRAVMVLVQSRPRYLLAHTYDLDENSGIG